MPEARQPTGFSPSDLAGVFRALQDADWDAVLVGGQAVNLWANRYERDLPAWRELRPYTSRDLDYSAFAAGIDLLEAIPTQELETAKDYAQFLCRRMPQLVERVRTRRERHRQALEG